MQTNMLIDRGKMLEVLGIEAELLSDLVRDAPLDISVPTCPGMTVGEVFRHLGSVFRSVAEGLRDGHPSVEWQQKPRRGQSLVDYLRYGFENLYVELSSHDPTELAMTWGRTERTYEFWQRRMAHEITIHRVDIQLALGQRESSIDPLFALDGIDEVLSLWFSQRLPLIGFSGAKSGTVAIRSGGQTWLAHAGPGVTSARRCHESEVALADAVISGTSHQTYLWLWGRAGPTEVLCEGDLDASGQLWALLRLATK